MDGESAYIDLLPAVRVASGSPRWLRRLTVFQARTEPIPATSKRGTPGELLEVVTLGDVHDPRILLATAESYLGAVVDAPESGGAA